MALDNRIQCSLKEMCRQIKSGNYKNMATDWASDLRNMTETNSHHQT